jgi:clamp loader A subunit
MAGDSTWKWEDSISYTKERLDPLAPGDRYPAFRVNRYLSRFNDSLLPAQEMNLNRHLDPDMQYEYLLLAVRRRRRFQKGGKKRDDGDLRLVSEHYKYSDAKAAVALAILTRAELKLLREASEQGGPARPTKEDG